MKLLIDAEINNKRVLMLVGDGINTMPTLVGKYFDLVVIDEYQFLHTLYDFFCTNSSRTDLGNLI